MGQAWVRIVHTDVGSREEGRVRREGAERLAHPRDPLWFGLAITSSPQEVGDRLAALCLGNLEVATAVLAHTDA